MDANLREAFWKSTRKVMIFNWPVYVQGATVASCCGSRAQPAEAVGHNRPIGLNIWPSINEAKASECLATDSQRDNRYRMSTHSLKMEDGTFLNMQLLHKDIGEAPLPDFKYEKDEGRITEARPNLLHVYLGYAQTQLYKETFYDAFKNQLIPGLTHDERVQIITEEMKGKYLVSVETHGIDPSRLEFFAQQPFAKEFEQYMVFESPMFFNSGYPSRDEDQLKVKVYKF